MQARPGRRRRSCPPRDLGLEALVEVLDGKRMVHFHTHRHDDILTALRLAKEFGFRVVLQHVSEAWKVADQIAAAGVPCSVIIIDSPGGKLEAKDVRFANGAALEKAGALVGFHTDDGITDSRLFLRSAGLAVRAGHVAGEGALRHDHGGRDDAGPRRTVWAPGGGQGRRPRGPVRGPAERTRPMSSRRGWRAARSSTAPCPKDRLLRRGRLRREPRPAGVRPRRFEGASE